MSALVPALALMLALADVPARADEAPDGPRPAYRVAQRERPGGPVRMRISDRAAFGDTGAVRKHVYAKQQPWNADGSLLLLSGWPYWLLDGRDFRLLRRWHGPAQPVWSNRDPFIVYGLAAPGDGPPAFVRGDVREDWSFAHMRLRAFPEYDTLDFGGGEGNLSADDRLVALFGRSAGGVTLFVYDIAADSVRARRFFPGLSAGAGGDIDNATVSPSGRWVIAQFGTVHDGRPPGTELLDADLVYVRRISPRHASHGDAAIDAGGDEVWVMPLDPASDTLHSYRLADGRVRVELRAAQVGNPNHVSCRSVRRPGWCFISGHARVGVPDSGDADSRSWRSVLALRLDGRARVRRVAATHHARRITEREYERAPMAVPDREGRRVLFASDWGDARAGAEIDVYVSGPASAMPNPSHRPSAPADTIGVLRLRP